MSEFHVELVRIGAVSKHPNADALMLTSIHGGYPVVFRTGDFSEGDLAVYLPVDSVAPDTEQFAFLGSSRRIKAKKLRGIFSMGMLCAVPAELADLPEGADVAEAMGVVRWDPPAEKVHYRSCGTNAPQHPAPATRCPIAHYDLEPLRRDIHAFVDLPCVVMEKIHGQNFRAVITSDGVLHIGSRNRWLDPATDNAWTRVATRYDLARRLKAMPPGQVVFGESYGNNEDMTYNVNRAATDDALAVFDIYDANTGAWWPWDSVKALCGAMGLLTAPELARFDEGASWEMLSPFAEGKTTINGASHVREGFVVKALSEDPLMRRILKMAGQGYYTRKGADAGGDQ